MQDLVSLEDVRHQVRLDEDDTSEDTLLGGYIAAAARSCSALTGLTIETASDADLAVVKQAMLMMIAHWYQHREAGDAAPAAVGWLLRPIKRAAL